MKGKDLIKLAKYIEERNLEDFEIDIFESFIENNFIGNQSYNYLGVADIGYSDKIVRVEIEKVGG